MLPTKKHITDTHEKFHLQLCNPTLVPVVVVVDMYTLRNIS